MEALFQHVFRYFSLPEDVLSHHGPQFVSRVWKAFFQMVGATVSTIQELSRLLRAYFSSRQHDWADFLAWAGYVQNLCHSSTSLMLFECVLACQLPLCPWGTIPNNVPRVDDWFIRAEQVWKEAHTQIQ